MQFLHMGQSSTGLTSRLFINNFDNSFVCAAGSAAVASAVFAVADETVLAAFFFARLAFFVAAFAAAAVEPNMGCSCIEQLMLLEQQ